MLFLDTGYHFKETYSTRDEVASKVDVNIVDVLPEQTVAQQDAEFGAELFNRDPGLCCARRKVAPLKKSLAGYELWFTGVRRDEAPTRANTPLVTFDEKNGLVKVNPLAAWYFDDLLDYAGAFDVPVNPLLSQGYPSIGCQPCTNPVAEGEDPRAGRWAADLSRKQNAGCTYEHRSHTTVHTETTVHPRRPRIRSDPHHPRGRRPEFEKPVLLFSGGKDFVTVLHLSRPRPSRPRRSRSVFSTSTPVTTSRRS